MTENGKKYVTWQGLLSILGGTILAVVTIGWSVHCIAKSDLQKQIDSKVEQVEYKADVQWIKQTLQDIKDGKIKIPGGK